MGFATSVSIAWMLEKIKKGDHVVMKNRYGGLRAVEKKW